MTFNLEFARAEAENAAWLKALVERVEQINSSPIPPLEELLREACDSPPEPLKTRRFTIEAARRLFPHLEDKLVTEDDFKALRSAMIEDYSGAQCNFMLAEWPVKGADGAEFHDERVVAFDWPQQRVVVMDPGTARELLVEAGRMLVPVRKILSPNHN